MNTTYHKEQLLQVTFLSIEIHLMHDCKIYPTYYKLNFRQVQLEGAEN